MTTIRPISEERFWDMFGIIDPAIMDSKGFMIGHPMSHRMCTVSKKYGQPTFAAFFQLGTSFYEANDHLTIEEYKAITPGDFRALIVAAEKEAKLKGPTP